MRDRLVFPLGPRLDGERINQPLCLAVDVGAPTLAALPEVFLLGQCPWRTIVVDVTAFSTRGSEAFAKMDDGYLAPSSIGPNGFVQFNYMLHGTQTVSGRGDTTLELLFAKNAGPGFLAFRANNVTGQGTTVIVNGAFVTTLPGLVNSTGSITVDTALSFLVGARGRSPVEEPASVGEHPGPYGAQPLIANGQDRAPGLDCGLF